MPRSGDAKLTHARASGGGAKVAAAPRYSDWSAGSRRGLNRLLGACLSQQVSWVSVTGPPGLRWTGGRGRTDGAWGRWKALRTTAASGGGGRPRTAYRAAITPAAKEVSQTGRDHFWARWVLPPYLVTAARPRARAIEVQYWASLGVRAICSCRCVKAVPGSLAWSSRSSRWRSASCGLAGLCAGCHRPGVRSLEEAVSTCASEPDGAHGTRVTARVPDSTRTTGRMKARVLPMWRAA